MIVFSTKVLYLIPVIPVVLFLLWVLWKFVEEGKEPRHAPPVSPSTADSIILRTAHHHGFAGASEASASSPVSSTRTADPGITS